jgi:glucose-1-phosphate thymidylyltransferase
MACVKGVILARGLGRRMRAEDDTALLSDEQRAAAAAGHKAMMPVAGRPLLDYLLSRAADAGLRDICLVVAPNHGAISAYYAGVAPQRLRLHYAVQPVASGTAHALLAARGFADGSPCVVMNADNLYPEDALRALATHEGPAAAAFDRDTLVRESGFAPARVQAFAAIDVDANGRLVALREKPAADELERSPLVSMNLWRVDDRGFQACADVAPSERGEYELPAAMMLAVQRGMPLQVLRMSGAVLDLSSRADVAIVGARVAALEVRL